MGGKALANFGVTRISAEEYAPLKEDLVSLAAAYGVPVHIPPEMPEKPDFGDIDLLIPASAATTRSYAEFKSELSKDGYSANGNVHSCAWRNHQVDLIICRDDCLEFTKYYLSYGIVGMVLGMMARRLGLKFTMDGIYVRGDCIFQDTLITRDLGKALNLIGVDYDTWERGFSTRNAVFAYLDGAEFSYVLNYPVTSGKAKHKKRERQSPLYNEFFQWRSKDKEVPLPPLPVENIHDTLLLISRRLPGEIMAVETKLAGDLYLKTKKRVESARYTFEDFSKAYVAYAPNVAKAKIGSAYSEFLAATTARGDLLTGELREEADKFIQGLNSVYED